MKTEGLTVIPSGWVALFKKITFSHVLNPPHHFEVRLAVHSIF